MVGNNATGVYPRSLRPKELDLLLSVLPAESSGYREYRELLLKMVVIGEGRRGAGNLVLGFNDDRADTISPLGSVVAYGMVETTHDTFSVTIREHIGEQVDVEIVSAHGEEIPDRFEEKRRWTYSTWKPGELLPSSGERVREIHINDTLVFGIARKERRLLLHDRSTGMNHLIPITNFYNELMLHKNIRDPKIVLNSSLFFQDLDVYGDEDLRTAFIVYNKLRRRVSVLEQEPLPRKTGIRTVLKELFRKQMP